MTTMTKLKWNAFRVFAVVALASAPAFANPIIVSNFGFETLPPGGLPSTCGTGCFFDVGTAVPGWVNVGPTGQFQPGAITGNPFYNSLPGGLTVAAANQGGSLSQTVGTKVAAGMTYTLMVDMGVRLGPQPFTGAADLLIGSGTTVVASTALTPVNGTFSTFKAIYTAQAADVGKTITIELRSTALAGGQQINFDNVFLTEEAPEPASFLLIGSALLGLTVLAGRRRKKS